MSDPVSPAAPRLHVLLLDDDAFTLELLGDMLAEIADLEVRAETDARRALRSLGERAPDLLICDLSMPDMDGIEFMQAAALAGYRGQVVLLSGMDTGVRMAAETLARAHGLNVVGAFRKPIGPHQLAAALAPLLALARGEHEILYNPTPLFGK